jgi:serine/threonine protein kinase/Tol biopolymer transport system component
MVLASGTRIRHYEVVSHLGTGGMGEVYLARDLRLRRPVALKLLLQEMTKGKEHLRRFEQEARATSALNHPNILTIHEIGHAGDTHFIAAEFIDGQTLRSLIRRQRLSPSEALDTLTQIASGLGAAHLAGVTHRDIKPENVMVRNDGYVKILDFGLAKLAGPLESQSSAFSHERTVSNVKTVSGTILGTIRYMSPEQLRGQTVDARADLWSLGVVLYEMIAGKPPFEGESPADTTVSILEKEAAPLSEHAPGCPAELERVAARLLAKKREERYQTVEELMGDLQRLRWEISPEVKWWHSARPRVGEVSSPGSGPRNSAGETDPAAAPPVTVPTNFGGRLVRRRRLLAGASAALLTGAILCIALFVRGRVATTGGHVPAGPSAAMRLKMLIDTGNVIDAAGSPDGKYVAYAVEEDGEQSLWVRQVASGNKIPLVNPAGVRYAGLTFTPDSNYVYYVIFEKNYGVLYQVSALGGAPRKILDDIDTPVSFSPDGRQFTFVRGYPALKETVLFIANADGSSERRLATRKSPEYFGWQGGPAWSPDGQSIVCAIGVYDLKMSMVEVRVAEGGAGRVISNGWTWLGRPVWLGDGSGLLVTAKETDSAPLQIWHLPYPDGEAKKVTNDLDNYGPRGLSLTADSKSLVALQWSYESSVWVARRGADDRARQISSGKSDGLNGLAWAPDGRIFYVSNAGGNPDIWVMNADGSGQRQLTFGGSINYHPAVSLDGRYVVFVSNRAGSLSLWRMDASGSNPKQLTDRWVANWPHCSPDGQWVVFKSFAAGRRTLWKVHIDGGEPVQITDAYSAWPSVSPDGKEIVCEYWDENPNTLFKFALLPFDGGEPLKVFSPPPGMKYLSRVIRWTPDGRALTYILNRDGVSNIWGQPRAGGNPTQLTRFKSGQIFWFDWSQDGKTFAYARGEVTSGVVMISDFRGAATQQESAGPPAPLARDAR